MKVFLRTMLRFVYILLLDGYSVLRGILYATNKRRLDGDERDLAHSLREDGFVVLPAYYSEEEVDRIVAIGHEYMREEFGDFDHIDRLAYYRGPEEGQAVDGGVFRLWGADSLLEDILVFKEDKYIRGLVESAFNAAINCNAVLMQKNLPQGSETRGYHIDMYAPRQFKAFLYLTDVDDEQHGPFAIVKSSHRWRWKIYGNFLRRALADQKDLTGFADLSASEQRLVHLCTAPKGTVVIATPQALHRGWPLVAGTRYVLVNYYVEDLGHYIPGVRMRKRLGYRYEPVPL